jgi:hypothetical protein
MSVGVPTCWTIALVHHDDAVGERHRLDLVVGDVDGGDLKLVGEVLDLGAGRDAELGVEVRERLVHQEDVGLADDGAGERHALALAARKLGRAAVEEVGQFHHRGRAHDALAVFGFGDAADLQREADVLVDVHVGVERVALEHHRHVAVLRVEVVHPAAVEEDVALGRVLQPRDHAHGGGLAAARGAEEDEELAVGDGEVEPLHADEGAPALGDAAEPDFRHVPLACIRMLNW